MSMKHTFVAATAAGLIAGSLVAPQAQAVHAVADGNYCKVTFSKEEQNRYSAEPSAEVTKAELAESISETKEGIEALEHQRIGLTGAALSPEELREFDNDIVFYKGVLKLMESALAQCNGTAAPNPKPGKDNPAPDKGVPAPEGDGGSPSGEGEGKKGEEGEGKNALSTEDGKLNGAGIGVVVAGVLVVLLGGIAAALPALKPMLPANIAAMLP